MKDVYIIGHTHAESNRNISGNSVKPTTLHILDITYRTGLEIGKATRTGSLYLDGYDEESVGKAERYLADILRHESSCVPFLKMAMLQMLQEGHIGEFSHIWSMLLYGTLSESGLTIRMRPADFNFQHFRTEIGPQLFYVWCVQNSKDPDSLTDAEREEFMRIETRFRDNETHQRIRETSTDSNLVIVGEAHRLESLMEDQDFRSYRVDVRHRERDVYSVSGRLPKSLSDIGESVRACDSLQPFIGVVDDVNLEFDIDFD